MDSKEPITVKVLGEPEINYKASKDQKIKVLWYSDFLRHTGFGNVAEAIMSRLLKTGKYEFTALGINYMGEPYNIPESDYYQFKNVPVYPAEIRDNLLGHGKLRQLLQKTKYDIFFTLQDTFNMMDLKNDILEAKKCKKFKYIFYFPIDGDIHEDWVADGVKVADYPVVYTDYGKKMINEIDPAILLRKIYHGVDEKEFYPFEKEEERKAFRAEYFNANDKDFVITNVNRNQPRKDLPRMIMAFQKFCQKYPEIPAKLYLHCHPNDSAGLKIVKFARKYLDKKLYNSFCFPDSSRLGSNGVPVSVLRKIYAGSDVLTSTTLGEGWGLSTSEAMACKVPVVMPNNTSLTEIIGANEERGYLADCSKEWFCQQVIDNDIIRPITDIDSLVEKWYSVYKNKEEAKKKAEAAYAWVQNYTWDKIAKIWDDLFTEAYNSIR
jgi:glycosyltransferase involved in cell wall biosynthesis